MKRALLFAILSASARLHAAEPLTPEEAGRLEKTPFHTQVVFENYGSPGAHSIGLIGFKFDQFITQNFFAGPAIFGAVTGDRGGYGIAGLGVGWQQKVTRILYWDTRVLAGSGGGNGTRTGGGILLHGVTGFQLEVLPRLRLAAQGGYLDFPTGHFRTPVASASVVFVGRKITLPYP